MLSIARSVASVYNLFSPSKSMPTPQGMATLAARLTSFEIEKPKGKKRTSNAKGKKANASSWPHESPTVEQVGNVYALNGARS